MLSPFDTRFFAALAEAAAETLPPGDACTEAARQAARTHDPDDLRNARQRIDDLPAAERERLLADVHRRLATDLSAIWDQLPGAAFGGRMN